MSRHWTPCRVCGAAHTNPSSSSICSPCGQAERDARLLAEKTERQTFEETPFGRFMNQSEDDRWREIFDRLEALEAGA